jgi:EamA domain-containing membrane protein RarD
MINLIGIILKIISSTFYLLSGIIWKKVVKKNINYHIIFYRSIFSIASTLLAILAFSKMDISENLKKLENIFKKIKSTDKDQNFKKDIKKNNKFINYLKKVYEDLKTE